MLKSWVIQLKTLPFLKEWQLAFRFQVCISTSLFDHVNMISGTLNNYFLGLFQIRSFQTFTRKNGWKSPFPFIKRWLFGAPFEQNSTVGAVQLYPRRNNKKCKQSSHRPTTPLKKKNGTTESLWQLFLVFFPSKKTRDALEKGDQNPPKIAAPAHGSTTAPHLGRLFHPVLRPNCTRWTRLARMGGWDV